MTPAEAAEELVLDEMVSCVETGTSSSQARRWERAWSLCAGAYAAEGRDVDARRCEDNLVALHAFMRSAGRLEVAS